MQIVKLMGGYANQLRQYVYGRYLEQCIGEPVYYDDSWFYYSNAHNGYELKRVHGMNLALISNYFPKVVFKQILEDKKPIYQVLYDAGVDIDLILNDAGEYVPFTGKVIKFNRKTAFAKIENSRYHWTYATEFEEYYNKITDIIDRDFLFPPFPDKQSMGVAERIRTTDSIGIHIRQGDFARIGWLSPPDYYKKCITWAEENLKPERYYIFSDDQEFCQSHIVEYGFDLVKDKIEFVVGHRGLNDYVDFQLMTLCKYFIVTPKSSFSHCACVFNKRLQTKINWQTVGMEFKDSFGWKRN